MSFRTAKKLQLDWPHKGEHVLQDPETGRWEFCGRKPLAPRPLIEIEAYGEEKGRPFDPRRSNLLIKGENLFALQSLLPYYAGQVKVIYIDPPFNTGNEFQAYDDNFSHSAWLGLMYERLLLLSKFLREDGVVFVHIDIREMPYLKATMDEIFSRRNFVSLITLQVKDPAGVGQQSPVFDVCEYLLAYAFNYVAFKNTIEKRGFEYEDVTGFVKGYNKALVEFGKPHLLKTIERGQVGEIKVFAYEGSKIKKFSRKSSYEDYISHFDTIFADYNPSGGMILAIRNELPPEGLSCIEYVPVKGKDAGNLTKVFFHRRRILAWLKDVVELRPDGRLIKRRKLINYWKVVTASLPAEGGVYLPQGKKPEALLHKIIDLTTGEGDLVLDAFAGSGTAGAVAHKMKRTWIMVELGDQAQDLALPRMQRVISGDDESGVTKDTNWQGGGGFRFLEVGAPLLIEDKDTELIILNPQYSNGPLVRAVCATEGFLLTGDGLMHGRNGNHFAHITEEFVDDAYIRRLKRRLADGQSLTLYALKIRRGLKPPKGISVKRMNVDLVKPYLKTK